jgi:hypothetical protein
MWPIPTVAALRLMLQELPDAYELMPNGIGNLSVWRPTATSRYYIGYIDLATCEVHLKPDGKPGDTDIPGSADNNFIGSSGDVTYVDESTFETNKLC